MESVKIRVKPVWVALAFFVFAICGDGHKILGFLIAFAITLYKYPAIGRELALACWDLLSMEAKATNLLLAMRGVPGSHSSALTELEDLKREIKHRQVPASAVVPLFGLVEQSILNYEYMEAGFSILGHLTKRLILQEQKELLIFQGLKTLPSIVDSLGDQRDRIRQRATQAIFDLWHLSSVDVEQIIRDVALTSQVPRVKEAGMRWILKVSTMVQDLNTADSLQTKKEHDMQFKSFVPGIIDCLEDSDDSVRKTAKATIIGLFR